MKFAKLFISCAAAATFPMAAMAQISPSMSAQIDAAAKPCADVAGAAAGQPEEVAKSIATAALQPCYAALQTLDTFEKQNGPGMTFEERNYFYYVGGNVIWMTAAAEAMKNDGQFNAAICQQVLSAEQAWGNVRIDRSSKIYNDMLNNTIRNMMLPLCIPAR